MPTTVLTDPLFAELQQLNYTQKSIGIEDTVAPVAYLLNTLPQSRKITIQQNEAFPIQLMNLVNNGMAELDTTTNTLTIYLASNTVTPNVTT